MTILQLDTVTLSLIIAITGTILHQIRTYNGKPIPKILDGAMATMGGSFVASYAVLSETMTAGTTDPFQQMLLVLSLVGFTIHGAALGQKAFSKAKQKIKELPRTSGIVSKSHSKKSLLSSHPPELFPKNSWYQTNFTKSDKKGNSLQYGQIHL